MKIRHMALASFAGCLALSSPARAAITITFNEGAEGAEVIPIPTVTGVDPAFFNASGGSIGNVQLIDFFAEAPALFSYTFNLLEPDGSVSDQITFSNTYPNLPRNLFVTFNSDPATIGAVGAISGTGPETGGLQTIPLPPNMPGIRDSLGNLRLTVLAQSDLDPAPEPTTWGMMLVGFAAIGLTTRYRPRRRNLVQVA